jgi:Domain of unknown function (DUF1877)
MYGEWLRVTPAELDRAKADLGWARDFVDEVDESFTGDDSDVADRRRFGTDKTWHALDYLLSRRDFPISVIYGEQSLVDDPDDDDADWGYGPPRYLTAAQVRQAADALAGITEEQLLDGVQQADLERENIYPAIWDRPGELPWAACYLPHVKTYFEAAAKAGDAIICWIG